MLYQEAAGIIDNVEKKKGSVKSLVLGSRYQNKKQMMALVCESMKYGKILKQIITDTKLMKLEPSLKSEFLAQVLVYDHLFGKGIHQASKNIKTAVLKHKAALNSELARIKIKKKVMKNEDLLEKEVTQSGILPKYLRVNNLKSNIKRVISHFQKEGFTFLQQQTRDYERFLDAVKDLKDKEFLRDLHVPDLLIFPAKTDLHDHVLYQTGEIIFQDKASCMPAFLLEPTPGDIVMDTCAAPGNKSMHAASLMENKGKIYSFDLDKKRLSTMSTLALKAGVLNTNMTHKDFLKTDPSLNPLSHVQLALVDPSCSGSGIVSRMNEVTDDSSSNTETRLEKLANFQTTILKHALSFPNLKRAIYSTCSIHARENEQVVTEVLEYFKGKFVLKPLLKDFPSRGLDSYPCGSSCLRFDPERDLTNGFFVACFEKNENHHISEDQDTEGATVTIESEEIADNENDKNSVQTERKDRNQGKNTKKRKFIDNEKNTGITKQEDISEMKQIKCKQEETVVEEEMNSKKMKLNDSEEKKQNGKQQKLAKEENSKNAGKKKKNKQKKRKNKPVTQ